MEEAHIVVDVDLAHLSETMLLEINRLGGKPKEKERDNFTIFPVPSKFRQSKKNLFDPCEVSIGPLHHGKESLKAMEDQKWRSLLDFLSRGDHISLDRCLAEMRCLEERTRRCYSESVLLDSNSFVKMMLLDGCFVLDRLISIGPSGVILSDLLLLENQIPFFIVEKLCEIGLKPQDRIDFTNDLVNIFAQAEPADDSIVPNPPAEIHHFLHLCYHCSKPINLRKPVVLSSESFSPSMLGTINNLLYEFFLWVFIRIFPKSNALVLYDPNSSKVIPCATMLQDAGIKFRAKSHLCHMFDISYVHGVLEIPRLTIINESKTVFANLIAFEQYKSDKLSANLSSFALFLDSLVNTPEDLKILHNCGIVNNCDEELIDFFNQICEGMVVEKDDHFLAELFVEVNKYCKKRWSWPRERWNRNKEQFIDEYFRSPWTAISLVAAVLVVLFTFVQTFFAVLAYFVPPS